MRNLPSYLDPVKRLVVWRKRTRANRELIARLLPRGGFVVYAGSIWVHPDHLRDILKHHSTDHPLPLSEEMRPSIIAAMENACEFGYRAGEKGMNLQTALIEFRKVMKS